MNAGDRVRIEGKGVEAQVGTVENILTREQLLERVAPKRKAAFANCVRALVIRYEDTKKDSTIVKVIFAAAEDSAGLWWDLMRGKELRITPC